MTENKHAEMEARRTFLKTVGAAAVTVPAAVLLLSAASRPVVAGTRYGEQWEERNYGPSQSSGDGDSGGTGSRQGGGHGTDSRLNDGRRGLGRD